MANLLNYISEGVRITGAAPADLTGGYILNVNGQAIITSEPIASGDIGSFATEGIFSAPYVGNACNAGDNLWWDANGKPYGGSADGAATNLGADGDFWIGTVVDAPDANDATVRFTLNKVNPAQPAWVGRTFIK